MAEAGQLVARVGREKGFEIREYPVPDAVPVAALVNEAFRQQEDGHITSGAIAPS